MKIKKMHRLAVVGVLVSLISAALIFGSVGATAYAAQNALPGDALYSVKTGLEQTRIALTRESIEKTRLNIQFADRRLDEMLQLAELERYQDLEAAVAAFQAYTAQAVETLGTVSLASEPSGAKELTAVVAGILTRQSLAMNQLAASLPADAQPALQDALAKVSPATNLVDANNDSSSDNGLEYSGTVEAMAADSWVIDGVSYAVDSMTMIEGNIQVGDTVEFYVFTAADGSQTLWKVELTSTSDGLTSQDDMDDDSMESSMDDTMDDSHDDDSLEMEEQDSMDDQEGKGMVEAVSETSWTIDGVTYLVDPTTKIEGMIQVGDWVEFHSITSADGSLALTKVELDSSNDHTQGNMDDMQYDSNEDSSQGGSVYNEDDHEDDHSGQSYEDDHEDDHDQNSGSGDHSDDHDSGDHEEHDDHDD